MRHYTKYTVTIAGVLTHEVEIWTEHNHASVYSGGSPVFDGFAGEANRAVKNELARLEAIARANGASFEVA